MRFFMSKSQELLLIPLCLTAACAAVACERAESPVPDEIEDLCPEDPYKTRPGVCGCGIADVVDAVSGLYACKTEIIDFCPNDPYKTQPGICGCGVADTKGADGIALCLTQNIDLCPNDPDKTLPGICGCGVADYVNDGTGIPQCLKDKFDSCPDDPDKTSPGVCGCGVADTLDPATGIPTCIVDSIDFCPNDPDKTLPGVCGCGVADADSDGDTIFDCVDACPDDPDKSSPGICGCGVADSRKNLTDDDRDGVPNCIDACPDNPYKQTDDGCSCSELAAVSGTQSLCAAIIDSAKTFVAMRDAWNSADPDVTSVAAFILADDINLADSVNDPVDWVGWGTAETPFNAIFFGNNHTISAAVQTASTQRQITLGNKDADDIALFGHADNAQIRDLIVDLSFAGKDGVAALIARANKTAVSNVRAAARISAQNNAAGLVAQAETSTFKQVYVQGSVSAENDFAACHIVLARNVQISQAAADCSVSGNRYAAGVASQLSSSKLVDVYANATVSGNAYASGMVGALAAHSSVLNGYAMSQVTCGEAPCALIVAYADEFATIKNVYAAGNFVDKRPEGKDETEQTEENFEQKSKGEENSQTNGIMPASDNDATEETGGTEAATDGGDAQNPSEDPETPVAQIPLAMIVASFAGADSVLSSVYYWSETQIPAVPDVTEMPGVEPPVAFSFSNLRPVTADAAYLPDCLNDALICSGADCAIDANACTRWTVGQISITLPDSGDVMSVLIPQLRF